MDIIPIVWIMIVWIMVFYMKMPLKKKFQEITNKNNELNLLRMVIFFWSMVVKRAMEFFVKKKAIISRFLFDV
ncbi:hypothetical protein GCM10023261_07220 [Bartonella jaculi]|uniref:Uncharacterized protein n=1 Tax=Bartonella jaculi TaxID=686226 RepID=A0ABP9N6J6_9HYPH